ncbi:MAG: (2Fe-2S)-binding protein [Sphaerochaeta sp.]|jgi:NAD(P)H-nitrite reductase large subunit|uniref:(2Fe-2S)-binding protein n=1 Tax=unclassified Sphaerochaeta TaxID=2637943 RepID=UPI0025E69D40|nr:MULTISPECIES: (2Fe-2S)-binding protein [unclassified Sphaerochaeta]MCK9600251.1 (2Fe-2S)-binding protein [Sphaerochaeta sp.]MDX9825011.1 (2Fe-2S)-binding protein [Sphaerochaeta sp.]MEA4864994.1 (2Fe-2S)-binding protein [Sphaerochaeta sp.]
MADDDKDMFICRCEEVTLGEIEQAIDEGFITVKDIKRVTRAGMGLCQGRTCSKTIARIIAQRTGKPLEEVMPKSYRYPVRPEKMQVVENEEFNDAKNS